MFTLNAVWLPLLVVLVGLRGRLVAGYFSCHTLPCSSKRLGARATSFTRGIAGRGNLFSEAMKPHEGELVREISKLQGLVSELKAGFSRALLELNQIQQGDSHLQAELDETRRGCGKRALHLEALVQSLREELGEVRCQILQLCSSGQKPEPDRKATQPAEGRALGSVGTQRESDAAGPDSGRCRCNGVATPPSPSLGAGLLLHCYLQGLRAGQCQDTDALTCQVFPRGGDVLQTCSLEGKRQRLVMMLLHSEWQYVSSLGQLYDKYKTLPAPPSHQEPHKTFLKYVEQLLQRHLMFRNGLEDRLSGDQWKCLVGDAFVKLTGHSDSAFSDAYIGYMTTLATILSTEFCRTPQMDKAQNTQEETEGLKLISLLLAPVSRIHSYLSIIQSLLDWTGREHPDWRPLQESERTLQHIRARCHAILERDVRWGEGPVPGFSGRCSAESPDCAPSAFTKYCANPRIPQGHARDGHPQRQECHLAMPQPVPPSAGILRNDAQLAKRLLCASACHPVPAGCWTQLQGVVGYGWERCHPAPLCGLGRRASAELSFLLNPPGTGGSEGMDSPDQGACARGPERRVCGPEVYLINRRLEDCDTDCDPEELGDVSVFDYSSVTSCSPDDTLEMRGCGGGEGSREEEEEEEEEEDSEVPVLLKPSYKQPGGAPREGAVCMRWQIPRGDPLPCPKTPPDLHVGGQIPAPGGSGVRRVTSTPKTQRLPQSAFRPVWDQPFSQGDVTPAKENTHTLRSVRIQERPNTSNFHQDRDNFRPVLGGSLYGVGCRGSPVGAQRSEGVWNESEDSEGPCSTV